MELKEAKKIINDFIKAMKPVFIVVNNDEINANLKKVEIEALETVLQALEKLQKENKKLKTKNRTQKELTELAREVTTEQVVSTIEEFEKDYISKDKIKEKIEEIKEIADEDNMDEFIKINVLEGLLKGE